MKQEMEAGSTYGGYVVGFCNVGATNTISRSILDRRAIRGLGV